MTIGSGLKIEAVVEFHPQNVRFQYVRFQNVCFKTFGFKTSILQNVRFTKHEFSKLLVSKSPVFKFDLLIKQKSFYICLYLLLAIMVIYDKKTSKIENKTQPSLCLQTWLQHNLRISTNHKYPRIFINVFLQPDVLKTWLFVSLTFCKPDVSDVLKPDVLKPDVLKPDVLKPDVL